MKADIYESSAGNNALGIRNALANGADPNEPHPRAGTLPLQLACQADAHDAIKELLNAGANADVVFTFSSRVNHRVIGGRTPLMYAQSCDAAQMLLDAGASVNRVDSMGWSAVVHAAHSANVDLVELLLKRGADMSVQPRYGGEHLCLLEFINYRCTDLEENAHVLRQPEAYESLMALRRVGQVVERFMQT